MRKEVKILFIFVSIILIVSMPLASAGWFSDFWNKITSNSKITGQAADNYELPPADGSEGSCSGTATSCANLPFNSPEEEMEFCEIQSGCSWVMGAMVCDGTATACSTFTTDLTCLNQFGCSWDSGTPIPIGNICRDGVIADLETCDDGNLLSGDGCSSSCQIEAGWICNGAPSVCQEISPPAEGCTDSDGDGYSIEGETCGLVDCNDNAEPGVNPGATEICGNNIDENCNGQADEFCTDYSLNFINALYSENAYENSELPVSCGFNLEGDYSLSTPDLATKIPVNCVQASLNGDPTGCTIVATNIGVDGIYKTFSCDVGSAGLNKQLKCEINTTVCNAGINTSSEIYSVDVITPVSCIANAEVGPLVLNVNETNIETLTYSSEGVLDLRFDIINSLTSNVLNLNQEISLYNLNTKEEIFSISQPSPVSTTEAFNFSFNLPRAGEQDKFRLYLKVYNPSNEIGACNVKKFDINIMPDLDSTNGPEIDFRNLTNKRVQTVLREVKTFTLDGSINHQMEVIEISNSSVVVTISSDPQNVTLEQGISQEVDLDGDGITDLNVTLISLEGEKVNIDLGILQEFESCLTGETDVCTDGILSGIKYCINGAWSSCQYSNSNENEIVSNGNETSEDINTPAPLDGESKKVYLYFALGIIGILILAIVIVLVKKKKKKNIPNNFGPAPLISTQPKGPRPTNIRPTRVQGNMGFQRPVSPRPQAIRPQNRTPVPTRPQAIRSPNNALPPQRQVPTPPRPSSQNTSQKPQSNLQSRPQRPGTLPRK